MNTHYQPVADGYRIIGSNELFNRALYGGHARDDETARFTTFAGDQPLIMGACNETRSAYHLAKAGVFMAGLAMTPRRGQSVVFTRGAAGGDRYSQWFHEAEGTVTTFRNGWMEYELRPFFQVFPHTEVALKVLPLQSEPGFLVHLRIWSEQRVHLVIGFGGVTDFLGPFGSPLVRERNFSPDDCRGNTVTLGPNRALVENHVADPSVSFATNVRLGTSFPVTASLGDPRTVAEGPGAFLDPASDPGEAPMVRLDTVIAPHQTWEGFAVVIQDSSEADLDKWLQHPDPVGALEGELCAKRSAITIRTPDPMLDLTVPPTVLALDACWHKDTFYHGAYEWHVPHIGWRNWYGPTAIGWHERVAQAVRTHAAEQVLQSDKPEQVTWEYSEYDRQNLPYHSLEGSTGSILGTPEGGISIYNMQEVYVDHFLHHLGWTGDLELAREIFPVVARILDWEERILDPDGDGLYQNWLNTWISDGHHYNGGGCAQASAYNYSANVGMARLAERLGHDPQPFRDRAEKIRLACHSTLWLPDRGLMAEYVDTIGNKLIHPSPELATAYHCIEAGLVDPFQAYQMLRFTETSLRNERTIARGGRLAWSSDWTPQMYSTCGIYTAENMHLAWAYFVCGLADKGLDLLTALVDAHFLGTQPGMACHNMSASGFTSGSQDFTDVLSMHLRLVVEGLFGVHCDLLDRRLTLAPNFPADWTEAALTLRDLTVQYHRRDREEALTVTSAHVITGVIRLPLRATTVEAVRVNGQAAAYRIELGIGRSYAVVEADLGVGCEVVVVHGEHAVPALCHAAEAMMGSRLAIEVSAGEVQEALDPSGSLAELQLEARRVTGTASEKPGWHTVFVRVRQDQWEAWLPADFRLLASRPPVVRPEPAGDFHPLDLDEHFNIALADIHQQLYLRPRPEGYSLMVWPSGRYCWDWNAGGYNARIVDDSSLRGSGGTYVVPSGVPFCTPAEGPNVACVSIWENFPTEMRFPLQGQGTELAILFIGVTNPMQSRVENGRFIVRYTDGAEEPVSLINPVNFHDWLNADIQHENEAVALNDYNHALVQRIALDPTKELESLAVRGVANEVIVGVLGLSVRRPAGPGASNPPPAPVAPEGVDYDTTRDKDDAGAATSAPGGSP